MFFTDYIEAHNYAVENAKKYNQCYGIEKMNQFGKNGFSVKMVSNNPNNRTGWEIRCEIVTPDSPTYASFRGKNDN